MSDSIAIKISEVSKKYTLNYPIIGADGNETSEHWALKDVSLEIKKGESVGIIGPNGSGKSTLLKILSGVTKPTSGSVQLYGKVASILDIGAGFHPELSGKENIFLNAQLLGFNRKEIKSKYDQIVDFSGIGKFIHEPVKNYSNGMYLRLAFSILAHLDFDIYLFDEVMSVGDEQFKNNSKKIIARLIHSKKTILLVSHNTKELETFSSHFFLDSGKLITKENINIGKYLEQSMLKEDKNEVRTSDFTIHSFPYVSQNKDIEIKEISLYQELSHNQHFVTDLPFYFKIKYLKKKSGYLVDLLMSISNINDEIILSSSPFVGGKFSDQDGVGLIEMDCKIPSHFFNSQIYSIHLWFLKDLTKSFNNSNLPILSEQLFIKNSTEVVFTMKDAIKFKPTYKRNEIEFDLSNLNIKGALLPQFEWNQNLVTLEK
jgi:lipopolysaccharide transport system ATP-binding protein